MELHQEDGHKDAMQSTLLIVDDETNILKALQRTLHKEGYQIYVCNNGDEALSLLEKQPIQVILTDQRMPGMTGSELLAKVKTLYPATERILLTAHADFDTLKNAINQGSIYKFLSKPWNDATLRQTLQEAFQITHEKLASEEKLSWLIDHDVLTGFPNHFLFNQSLSHMIKKTEQEDGLFAIIIFDLDRFNRVSEHLGQIGDDDILKIFSTRLALSFESQTQLSRLGDKFYAMLEYQEIEALHELLDGLVVKLNQPVTIADKVIYPRVHIGVSLFPEHGRNYDDLINHARIACAASKDIGPENWQMYKSIPNRIEPSQITEEHLHEAIEKKQFVVYYQPVIDATTQVIQGVEALIRWQHPTHGFISPDSFIPLCEKTGLIVPIGAWVLESACEQLKRWQQQGHTSLHVAVNLSTKQLLHPGLLELIQQVLSTTQITPSNLALEITESVMMRDLDSNAALLQKISDLSVKISIDDFGTGYSSLNYLKRLPVDILKIDKSFIDDLTIKKTTQELLKTIITLAKIYDLQVVAEGVETKEQFAILKQHHCDFIQGYLFSKPVSASDFETLLVKGKFTE